MKGLSSSFLGVAVSDRAIACAEVGVRGDRRVLRRTATFALPSELSLQTPEAVGQALAGFLRQKRFTASRAVVGVPARWLIAVEKEVPPSNEQQARAMLRLAAERLAIAENGELVFDFAGETDASRAQKVLLVGVLRDRLQRVERMMDSAGMRVVAITSTGLALAAKARADGIVMLADCGMEMVLRQDGTTRLLRHVPVTTNGHGTPAVAHLGAEVRRAVALTHGGGDPGGEMLLWDGLGLNDEHVSELSTRAGVNLRVGEGAKRLGVEAGIGEGADASGRYAPALALAIAAGDPQSLPVDFTRARLTPPTTRRISPRKAVGIGLVGVVVILLATLAIIVQQRGRELAALDSQITQSRERVRNAQATLDRFDFARGFYDLRPPVLDCMREITLAFRDEERIWVTSLTLRESGRGQLSGRAVDQKLVLAVLDRLKANDRFGDVKLLDMREADGRTREVSFSMSFEFKMTE